MPFFSNILTCFAGAANAESKKEPGHAATRVGPSAAAFFHGSYQSGQHELPGCPSSSCTHAETVVSSGIFACQSNGRGSQGPGRGREVGCVHRVHDEAELVSETCCGRGINGGGVKVLYFGPLKPANMVPECKDVVEYI